MCWLQQLAMNRRRSASTSPGPGGGRVAGQPTDKRIDTGRTGQIADQQVTTCATAETFAAQPATAQRIDPAFDRPLDRHLGSDRVAGFVNTGSRGH
jgi:hypothetical protein